MSENKSSYGNIFKTTFLFGFVQVFNILVKIGINKVVALVLGAEGLGIIGLFNSTVNTIKTGAGLGISQSAVRDISEANGAKNREKFSRIISLTNYVIWVTSILGVVVTIALSPLLSKWQFNNSEYILSFVWLSIVVGLNIMSDGQLAILKGMRQLRSLAKATMIGSVVGLVSAVPFYYFLGKGGIIPSLMITAFSSLFFSNYFVRKIEYDRVKMKLKEIVRESSMMVKMGIALMLVSFMGFLFDLIVSSYISSSGSLTDVGLYHAGTTIISSYFGIVITAMSTDYYPRISAVHSNNEILTEEMNKQSITGLIMVFPLVVLFVFLSPFFIDFLYSDEFYATNNYTDYAMIGTVIIIVSNCMGMILLAKQASKIFISSVVLQRALLIIIYLLSYTHWGLTGLGFAYICNGLVHILFMTVILKKFYSIKLSKQTLKLLLLVILTTIITILARKIDLLWLRYICGSVVLLFSCIYTISYMRREMQIDIIKIIGKHIKR